MATLKVGIYHLRFDPNAPPLLDIVKLIEHLPGKKRAAMIIDDPIRPRDRIEVTDQCCVLDFSRIPQIDRIDTGDLAGQEGEIKFGPDDQRPCRYTVVLLDQHSNTMYIHEGAGVSHVTVGKYLKAVADLGTLHVEVVLHDIDALERLRTRKHRSFRVRIAGIENAF